MVLPSSSGLPFASHASMRFTNVDLNNARLLAALKVISGAIYEVPDDGSGASGLPGTSMAEYFRYVK